MSIREMYEDHKKKAREKKQQKAAQKAAALYELEKNRQLRLNPYGDPSEDEQQRQTSPKEKNRQQVIRLEGNIPDSRNANIIGDGNRVFSFFTKLVNRVEYGIPEEDREKLVQAMTGVFVSCAEDVKRSMLSALERQHVDATKQEDAIEAIGKLVVGLLEQQLVDIKAYEETSVDGVVDVMEQKFRELSKKCDEICAALANDDLQDGIKQLHNCQNEMGLTLARVLEEAKDVKSLETEIKRQNFELEKSMMATRKDLQTLLTNMNLCVEKEKDIENMIIANYEKSLEHHQQELDNLQDIKSLGDIMIKDIAQIRNDINQLKQFIENMVRDAVNLLVSKIDDFRDETAADHENQNQQLAYISEQLKLQWEFLNDTIKKLEHDSNASTSPMQNGPQKEVISALKAEVTKAEKLIKRSSSPNDKPAQKASRIISRLYENSYIKEEITALNAEMEQKLTKLLDDLRWYLKSISLTVYYDNLEELRSSSEAVKRLNGWMLLKGMVQYGGKCDYDNVDFSHQIENRIEKSINSVQKAKQDGDDSLYVANKETDEFEEWLREALHLN